MVTSASGMAAPDGSLTVPAIVPEFPVCARSAEGPANAKIPTTSKRKAVRPLRIWKYAIEPPQSQMRAEDCKSAASADVVVRCSCSFLGMWDEKNSCCGSRQSRNGRCKEMFRLWEVPEEENRGRRG